jgi:imidazole glycerol-phosphate synthase subunit HisF
MLKKRLIPVLFLKNGLIVRSEKFSYHQNLGNPISEAKRYSGWNVDELIYIDISKDKVYDLRRDDLRVTIDHQLLDILIAISKVCFMPLTFGGGIRTLDDVRQRLFRGADKITINTIAIEQPDFITQCSNTFGAQCTVVSIDYKVVDNKPVVFKGGAECTDLDPVVWAHEAQERGAGEIFLNSIDRDGMSNGYDIEVIGRVCEAVQIPVIACGGAGSFRDFEELAQTTSVSAIAAGNIFHFTELAYPRAKDMLLKKGVNVRKA